MLLGRPGRRVRRTASGVIMNLDLSVEYERELYFGLYERSVVAVLMSLFSRNTLFIDAGANIGCFTLLAASVAGRSGRVVAFEVDPANARALRENIELNNAGVCVDVRGIALGNRTGTTKFVTGEHGVGSTIETADGAVSRLGPEYVGAYKSTIDVPVTTLDKECLTLLAAWSGPKIMKMDIEGSEPFALEGAKESLKYLDAAIIEQNPFMLGVHKFSANKVVELMLRYDFSGFIIDRVIGRTRLRPVDTTFRSPGNILFVRNGFEASLRRFGVARVTVGMKKMALKTRRNCEICGSVSIHFDFALGDYRIMRCRRCGFGRPQPLPTEDEILRLYHDSYGPRAICDTSDFRERKNVVRTISRLCPPPARVLDVGCGFGQYLDIARRCGFRTFGVEPDRSRAAEAIRKGHNVQIGVLSHSTFQGVYFDVVIFSHVIEHLSDPAGVVKQIGEHMVRNGLLFIATPNFVGVISAITGLYYTPPEHIAYFTRASLKRLLENCGFYLVREKPFTHYLRTKDMLAHILKFKFLRKATWQDPRVEHSPKRFVEGKFSIIRIIIYHLVLAVSKLITPIMNVLGEDHLHMYWRRR